MAGRNRGPREPGAEPAVKRPPELDRPIPMHPDVGDLSPDDQVALVAARRKRQAAARIARGPAGPERDRRT